VGALDWARCGKEGLQLTGAGGIYLGLDIGWRWDTTAIVPAEAYDRESLVVDEQPGWWRYRKVRYGKPTILTPPRDGTSLRRKAIIDAILAYRNMGFQILGVVFDRNAEGEAVAQELEETHGIPVIEHTQDPSPMADAAMGFVEGVGAGDVEHPFDEEFTAHVLATKAKTTSGEKWRLVPPEQNRGSRKRGQQDTDDVEVIDAAIAAVMLHRTATAPHPPEVDRSAYRMEFV
jgi:hypothetical protein